MTAATLLLCTLLSSSASVVGVRGIADLQVGDTSTQIKRFQQIPEGATVVTQKGSHVNLRFQSGSLLRIGPNTKVRIQSLKQRVPAGNRKENIKLVFGKVWARVMKIVGDNSNFEIRTDHAVAGVRGTAFWASSHTAGDSFTVDYGAIDLQQSGEASPLRLSGRGATAGFTKAGLTVPRVATASQLQALQEQTGGASGQAIIQLRAKHTLDKEKRTPRQPRKKPVNPTKFDENELQEPTPESELGKLRDQKATLKIRIRGL